MYWRAFVLTRLSMGVRGRDRSTTGMLFARFAQDAVLEFRIHTGYGQRNPSYVCSPWWVIEVWDAPLGSRRGRLATCTGVFARTWTWAYRADADAVVHWELREVSQRCA